jgi:hypothetical protein
MRKIVAVFVVISLTACLGPSEEEKKAVSEACQDFIEKNVEMGFIETKVFDIYKKKRRDSC